MKHTPLEQKIFDIVQPVADDLGLEVLYVQVQGNEGTKVVVITAEDPETGRLSIDKCSELSRAASVNMDVEDPIEDKYKLEVSSPGIDRLLLRRKDFETYQGFDTKIELHTPVETGQKRFRGILKGIDDQDNIAIETDEGLASFSFEDLKKAKLVLTDELIKATAGK